MTEDGNCVRYLPEIKFNMVTLLGMKKMENSCFVQLCIRILYSPEFMDYNSMVALVQQ